MCELASSIKAYTMPIINTLHVVYLSTAGYVQGMSDLLAPLLSVMENEVDTFWCFAGFMEMVVHILLIVHVVHVS